MDLVVIRGLCRMDKLIPIVILVVIIIIGYIYKIIDWKEIRSRISFTEKYHLKYHNFIDEVLTKRSFNHQLYGELTLEVKKMQNELGQDGIYAHMIDPLKGYKVNNYPLLINFLPDMMSYTNSFILGLNNSILMERLVQEANACNDMFIRHLGTLYDIDNKKRKGLPNPFSAFAEGVKTILLSPLLLLHWFGFVSTNTTEKARSSQIVVVINAVVALIGFVGSVMTIIIGWNDFWGIFMPLLKSSN